MGPIPPFVHGLCLARCMSDCILGVSERRPRTCRKGRGILYRVLNCLLCSQPDHVDRGRSSLPTLQIHRKRQRHVGLVLCAKHPRANLSQYRRLRPPLPPPRLGSGLRHHRGCHRSPSHPHLRSSLLPRLEQTQAHEVHEHPQQRSLGSLSRPATSPVRSQHPRLRRLQVTPAQIPLLPRGCQRSILGCREGSVRYSICVAALTYSSHPDFPTPASSSQNPAANPKDRTGRIRSLPSYAHSPASDSASQSAYADTYCSRPGHLRGRTNPQSLQLNMT